MVFADGDTIRLTPQARLWGGYAVGWVDWLRVSERDQQALGGLALRDGGIVRGEAQRLL